MREGVVKEIKNIPRLVEGFKKKWAHYEKAEAMSLPYRAVYRGPDRPTTL